MPVISVDYEDLVSLMSKGTGYERAVGELISEYSMQAIVAAIPRLGGDSALVDNKLELEFFPNSPDMFSDIPGRPGAIVVKKKGAGTELGSNEVTEIGSYGELQPKVLTAFELGYPVIAFEADAEALDS